MNWTRTQSKRDLGVLERAHHDAEGPGAPLPRGRAERAGAGEEEALGGLIHVRKYLKGGPQGRWTQRCLHPHCLATSVPGH